MTGQIPDAAGVARVPIPADPERDKRVAARRAEDARKAGRALDYLLADGTRAAYVEGFADGYAASELHHNRHYGASGGVVYAQCFNPQVHGAHVWWDHQAPEGEGERLSCPGRTVRDETDPCAGGRCPDPEAHAEGAHDV